MGTVTDIDTARKQATFEAWASDRVGKGLVVPAYCDPSNEKTGLKYDSNLDVKDIARLVRGELKQALPGFKFSVRISRYSGGQSVDVSLADIPADVELYNPEWIEYRFKGERAPHDVSRYSELVTQVVDRADAILQAYNRNNSDSQSDYFDVNFYGHVRVDYRLADKPEHKPRYRAPIAEGGEV